MTPMLPPRRGPRPRTTDSNPHTQLDQQPDNRAVREELARRVFALADVVEQPSGISVPGARALVLVRGVPAGPDGAFMIGREFAHLHPDPDMSLHLTLPVEHGTAAVEAGWAELHPAARDGFVPPTAFMVFAPRDAEELDVVTALVAASHRFAHGGE